MAKLNYTVAMNLLTENFKQGANSVKTHVQSMRKSLLGLAAVFGVGGLSITAFVKSMFNAGVEMSKAEAKLRAATKTTSDYNSALNFCKSVADKYRLSVDELIASYSNYTATATSMGVSQKDQQTLYESLTRACKTHLVSQEQTSGVIEAVSLAMRKGTVTSKQFAGAIGSAIPEASRVMGDALGVNQEQLKKMFSKGKIGITELVKFANQLNKEIKAPKVDTISGAFAAIHNDIIKIAESTDVAGAYKNMLNGIVKVADGATTHLSSIFTAAFALMLGIAGRWAGKMFMSLQSPFVKMEASAKAATLKTELIQEKYAAKQAALNRAIVAEKTAAAKMEQVTNEGTAVQQEACQAKMQLATERRIAAEKALIAQEGLYNKAKQEETVLVNQAAAMKSMSAFQRSFIGIKASAVSAFTAIGTFLKSNWLFLVISVVAEVALSFKSLKDEEKESAKKLQEYKDIASGKTGTTDEIEKMKILQGVVNNTNNSLSKRKQALNEINNMLNTSYSLSDNNKKINDQINGSIAKRIALMETEARMQGVINQISTAKNDLKGAQEAVNEATKGNGITNAINKAYNAVLGNTSKNILLSFAAPVIKNIMIGVKGLSDFYVQQNSKVKKSRLDADNEIIKNGEKQVSGWMSDIEKYNKELGTKNNDTFSGGGSTTSNKTKKSKSVSAKEDELTQAINDYNKSILEAKVKHDVEKTSVQEYNQAIDEINVSTYEGIKASNNKRIAESDFAKEIEKRANNKKYDRTQDEMDSVISDYNKKVQELTYQLKHNIITEEDFNSEMADAAKAAQMSASQIQGIGKKADDFVAQMSKTISYSLPTFKIGKRDTTFDYRNSELDNKSSDVEWKKQLIDRVNEYKKQGGQLSESMQQELDKIVASVPDLERALKVESVKKDLKDLNKELKNAKFDSILALGDGFINVGQSISSITQAFGGESKEFDKILSKVNSLWQAFTSVFNVIKQVGEAFENLKAIKIALAAATKAETVAETTATTAKVASATQGAAAELAASTVTKATAHTDVAANAADAASSQAKHAAKLPWPFGIIAAGSAIAAIMLLFSKLTHFENGGIVSGTSFTGDKVLARVNSGEMILNRNQQSKLFNSLSGSQTSLQNGTKIESLKVRGSDLYLTLQNYMKSTGKKF